MYKYEMMLMGGLPEEGLARAGVKIRSKVAISRADVDSFILKVNILTAYFRVNNSGSGIMIFLIHIYMNDLVACGPRDPRVQWHLAQRCFHSSRQAHLSPV